MELKTNYLGLELKNPLVVSASPLSRTVENIKQMEDAGASAVVLYSLFEEQLRADRQDLYHHTTQGTDSFPEAMNFVPEPPEYHLGPEEYLNHLRKAKETIGIPIIASLNGTSIGSWTDYAKKIEEAGADALELNIYYIASQLDMTSEQVEGRYIDILREVKSKVKIPVALKLGPFFTNFAHMAKRFEEAGADALVLFNRFYQPDIELETLDVVPNILLSTPQARRLPLRWIALLYGRVKVDFAATSGIATGEDVIKMIMAGANVTMLCSVLLRYGFSRIRDIENQVRQWMDDNEYESIEQMRGSMSYIHCDDPSAYERALYVTDLHSFKTFY